MKVTCPKDHKHDRFETVVHVTEDWVVNNEGTFQEVSPTSEANVVHGPTVGNTFTCLACGSEANVEG